MATMKHVKNIYNSCEYNVQEVNIHSNQDKDGIPNRKPMNDDTLTEDIPNRRTTNDAIVDGATVNSLDDVVMESSTVGNNNIDRNAMSDNILDGVTANSGALIHDNACIQGPTVDDWQTVSENLTYVYSAHLDPDSSETQSGIHIVGSILAILQEQPKYNTLTSGYYCRVWVKSGNQNATEVFTAQVINISGRGYTFGL